jgi:hypothetical protein
MEWISVEHKLPKPLKEVIVSEKNGYVGMSFYFPAYHMVDHDANEDGECDEDEGVYYVRQGWYTYGADGKTFSKTATPVTHWMPKPKAATHQSKKE